MATAPRPRVLLGTLGPIMGVGMVRALAEHGCEILGHEQRPTALLGATRRLRPDIVVLDLDGGSAHDLGQLVRGASPDTTVVLWGRDEDQMEVLQPVSAASRAVATAALEGLRSEMTTNHQSTAKE